MSAQINKPGKHKIPICLYQFITISLCLSLSFGFVDVIINLLTGPSGLSSFKFVQITLISTTIFFLFLYLLVGIMLLLFMTFFRKYCSIIIKPLPSILAFEFCLGTIFILTKMNNIKLIFLSLTSNDLFRLFIFFLISFFAAIGIYFTSKNVIYSNYKNAALVLGLTIPFVWAETMFFIWLHKYKFGYIYSMQSYLLNIGYILIVLLTFMISYKFRNLRFYTIMNFFYIFMICLIFSPILISISMRVINYFLVKDYKHKGHQIKHVILITVDTLRADMLSCYNQKNLNTPYIDQLAKDGLLFTKTFSASPWTLPSFSSIMTGLSPYVHMTKNRDSKLPDSVTTLAEYFYNDGFYTAAIGANPFLTPKFNINQGFVVYNWFQKQYVGDSLGLDLIKRLFPDQFRQSIDSTRNITELTIDWLKSNNKKDFFLWIHYLDPHLGYNPPSEFLPKNIKPQTTIGTSFSKLTDIRTGNFVPTSSEKKWIKILYESEIRYVDKNIGIIFEILNQFNLYNESLIIFTSDHGEEFWEHGGYEHGHSLYNELLQVPLIIKLPYSYSKGQIVQEVSTQCITPTILDLCKINYNCNHLSSGSLLPLWESKSFAQPIIVSTSLLYYEDRESIIFNGFKYTRSLLTNHEELYNLTSDPNEKTSILLSFPDKTKEMRNLLLNYKNNSENLKKYHNITETRTNLDEETIQQLRALGYVQ